MYRAFVDEQDERLMNGNGPRQIVSQADLLLHKVFSNPMNRGKEIVTDPVFQAFIEKNRLRPKGFKRRRNDYLPTVPVDDEVMVFERTYKLEERLFEAMQPQEGFQIALT